MRIAETPQLVEWVTQSADMPYLLNTNATLTCRVIVAWREEFTVSVVVRSLDGKEQDITSAFQQVEQSEPQYWNATIYGSAPANGSFPQTNSSIFVRRSHQINLQATRKLDASMDNKTLVCLAVSKHYATINASDALFFRLMPDKNALPAYRSNRSSDVFKQCPQPSNMSFDFSKVDSYVWRCCLDLGGGNVETALRGNRDNHFAFNFTNLSKKQNAIVNTQAEMLAYNSYIEFKEPKPVRHKHTVHTYCTHTECSCDAHKNSPHFVCVCSGARKCVARVLRALLQVDQVHDGHSVHVQRAKSQLVQVANHGHLPVHAECARFLRILYCTVLYSCATVM